MLKFFYSLLILICFILAFIIFMMKDFLTNTDVSLYSKYNPKTYEISKNYKKEKTWLISYASGDAYVQNQTVLNMSASMHQVFDVFISYQPKDIDPEFYEKNKAILSQARGVGYWLWKPYIILKTLQMMPENDILVYLDRSSIVREGVFDVLALAKDHDRILFPGFHSNRRFMKKVIIDKVLDGDNSIRDKTQLESGFWVIRNNEESRKIIQEWLEYCQDPELITDIPMKDEYPDLIENRHDQAIMTALYYKYPEKFYLYDSIEARKKAFFVTRRSNPDCSLLSAVFNKRFGDFDINNLPEFIQKIRSWFIGCQQDAEPICTYNSSNKNASPICERVTY